MKKSDFLVVKNSSSGKDCYIKPDSIDQIINGVLRVDKDGHPVLGGDPNLCSIHCDNGLVIIVSALDSKFIISKIANRLIRRG